MKKFLISLIIFSTSIFYILNLPKKYSSKLVSTFSIVAIDTLNGDVGVAVQSKFPNVRPVVPWAEAGVGAIATQSFVNVSFGKRGLTLMREGATAHEALKILINSDAGRHSRQVGIIDSKGNSASWTGAECFDWAGGLVGTNSAINNFGRKGEIIIGKGFAAQGNILVGRETVEALANTFRNTKGSLADRLLASLIAGGKAGGDRRGEQSAALLVKRAGAGYDNTTDDLVDISVYDHQKPLQELERLYNIHKLFFFKSDPNNLIDVSPTVCKELQSIMSDKNYKGFLFYSGPIDGNFSQLTKKALQDFMGWENYDVRIRQDNKIDKDVLADIRIQYKNYSVNK
ncbi:MAG: DUF1028 domain-containing protein [Bacteroidetes bacterium]|nr:DUF1028 domain-containing protein [Bacteroidota bacterium]